MVSNSLLEYLHRKVEQLERENAELLQENAVLRYENMMLTPRKGDAEDVAGSLSADAI
jgi:regulator of replication initiation timing